ncbi:tyrosine-type recombinase/integrase [Quatrionicoccus australiensis]|uniref:tyrosine-type recombinase/integrase n=1 Tax=Quatrionicoccus australiensis TaxID=138118 RepID=UPI001CF9043C|nr:integrase arm-type DNA-binding domain-containing protein [Quatrionicoccus australiensis]UCV14126.1 integrase arm-type DNA-binding domain-containing protein [Quatrionicoccus australiensis]
MPLSDTGIRASKPREKAYKVADEKGLFLLVNPGGSRLWRLKYRIDGKEKLMALGAYPDVGLKDARDKRDEARKLIAAGIDPAQKKKSDEAEAKERATNTFELVACEWHENVKGEWIEKHAVRTMKLFERDLFPFIGGKPINEIKPRELLECLRRVEKRGTLSTAHRLLTQCGQVFRYGVASDRCERDTAADLRDALVKKPQVEHFAAITDPKRVGELMRMIDAYQGTAIVSAALKLSPMLFVRPGELRIAEWSEMNLDAAVWELPAKKMKMRNPHVVPLPAQAVAILRELHEMTGHGKHVFPSWGGDKRPMSSNTVRVALRAMGVTAEEMTAHGFRAMARTILDEVLGFRVDLIEHQLAHNVVDPNGRAYNRTAFLVERRDMMQRWADYLDKLKAGAEVIALERGAA